MSSLLPVLQILEHMQGGRRVNRRYARRSEDTEQMSVMDWARWNQNAHPELELLHHCPNGGSRNKAEAVKLKQMGVKAGIPDLCLPVPMGMYNGLYIEMKYDTGRLEDSQKKMLKALAAAGHYCTVCYGAGEAKIFCDACEWCRWYDGDTKNPDKWKQECDEYIITEEQAKRNRKKFKIVK